VLAKVNLGGVIGIKAENGDGMEGDVAVRFDHKYLSRYRKGDMAEGIGYE
jgi:hypothetical protein